MHGEKRKHRIRIILYGIALSAVLFLLRIQACATAENLITAACPAQSGETVDSRNGKDGMILSLPGCWDLRGAEITCRGFQTVYLGDELREAGPGKTTDLTGLIGRKIAVRSEQKKYICDVTILQGSAVPALFLHVDADALYAVNRDKRKEITEGRALIAEADGTVSYDGALTQLKGRGNATFAYSKKPYQIKLARKAAPGGMSAAKTWILLANWTDNSLLRNQIVLNVSRAAGLPYALDCRQADLWINGQYNGLYLLTEKAQIGKDRMRLADQEKAAEVLNARTPVRLETFRNSMEGIRLIRCYRDAEEPEDITGGYLMTIEKWHRLRDDAIAGFKIGEGLSIHIKEPTRPGLAQAEYLARRMLEVQKALEAENGINPETGKAYTEYLDRRSFALKYLIEEWCKNFDYLGGSQYMYKDSDRIDPLIYAGPAWDYDLCFGSMSNLGAAAPGDYVTVKRNGTNIWWLLYRHADFREEVRCLWQERFRPVLKVLTGEREAGEAGQGQLQPLDALRELIADSALMNAARWGIRNTATVRAAGGSFDNAAAYLKRWIEERIAYMDRQYGTMISE